MDTVIVGWTSLVPAIVTILIAVFTRKVAAALFCGILAGVAVITGFSPLEFLTQAWDFIVISFTDMERVKIVAFIMLIGGMLKIIESSGAYDKFAEVLSKKINSSRKSRLTTWFVSFCLFFDDYANVLISGSSMKSINLKNKVSPAFLAYMVDVLATMASVMLISTWASYEGDVMMKAGQGVGVEKSLSTFFLESLPYHMYTYLGIFLTLIAAYTGKWFGGSVDRQNFVKKVNANEGAEQLHTKLKASHVLVPVLSLLGLAIIGMFAIGITTLIKEGEPITLINILGNAPTIDILIGSTIIALILAYTLLRKDGIIGTTSSVKNFAVGVKDMIEVGLVIFFATGLSAISDALGTGEFIANGITPYLSPEILPALIFLISMLITVATGFSWSSMAIVMPIAFQLSSGFESMHLIPILSAAVISGAVSGEHVIPFSEKAVMSSAACGIPSVYHIKTMMFQTMTVLTSAFIGFLLIGYGFPLVVSYLIPIGLIVGSHLLFAKKIDPVTYQMS
ncbi:MAG: Na+/H+ antiporter NhaC family protein [Hyphomicrobiales bacterium]